MNTVTSPWHKGEVEIQRRKGVVERMEVVGLRNVRDHLISQHRQFFPMLPFVVVGSVDVDGNAWATLLSGHPGFLAAPDPTTLHIGTGADASDPAAAGLDDGDAVGLLGIQLETRRRNRLNGIVRRRNAAGFDVAVEHSFGNCDRYITLRQHVFTRDPAGPKYSITRTSCRADDTAVQMILKADTFFVASYVDREDGRRQVDVSHRGGKKGFVKVDGVGVITIPDYAGNNFFNTLGNIHVNPKCGLLFTDFESGDMLHLTGDGEVIFNAPELTGFEGAERLWRFRTRKAVFRRAALPMRFVAEPEPVSGNSLLPRAITHARTQQLGSAWQPFRVARVVVESSEIRSLYLEPADAYGLLSYKAGQHLPLRLQVPGETTPLARTYTLSSAPSDRHYRISVKKQGRASSHLHRLNPGDTVEVKTPSGDFTIDPQGRRPAVLIAAGVGITPMLSMLREIVYEGIRNGWVRPTWLFCGASSKATRAFEGEIEELRRSAEPSVHVVRALSDVTGARTGDYEVWGRIGIDLLRSYLRFDDYDFYICGPSGFMQELYDGLAGLNISDDRIHLETFGPASLRRRTMPAKSKAAVPVEFAASDRTAMWTAADGTLLELAEATGLQPSFSCRAGTCGSCRTKVVSGAVEYYRSPAADHDSQNALICCARPSSTDLNPLRLDL